MTADGRQTRESREIAPGLGMSRPAQHSARLRHQRKDVPGLAKILGARIEAHGRADRVRAIVGRDAGRHALRGFDRHGEVRAPVEIGLAHHQRQTQLAAAVACEREANQSSPVTRHEVHVLGPHELGGHDEVTLVLAVLVVHDDDHPASTDVLEQLVDGIESPHSINTITD